MARNAGFTPTLFKMQVRRLLVHSVPAVNAQYKGVPIDATHLRSHLLAQTPAGEGIVIAIGGEW